MKLPKELLNALIIILQINLYFLAHGLLRLADNLVLQVFNVLHIF